MLFVIVLSVKDCRNIGGNKAQPETNERTNQRTEETVCVGERGSAKVVCVRAAGNSRRGRGIGDLSPGVTARLRRRLAAFEETRFACECISVDIAPCRCSKNKQESVSANKRARCSVRDDEDLDFSNPDKLPCAGRFCLSPSSLVCENLRQGRVGPVLRSLQLQTALHCTLFVCDIQEIGIGRESSFSAGECDYDDYRGKAIK